MGDLSKLTRPETRVRPDSPGEFIRRKCKVVEPPKPWRIRFVQWVRGIKLAPKRIMRRRLDTLSSQPTVEQLWDAVEREQRRELRFGLILLFVVTGIALCLLGFVP